MKKDISEYSDLFEEAAELYEQLEEYEKAVKIYEKLVELPEYDSSTIWLRIGVIYRKVPLSRGETSKTFLDGRSEVRKEGLQRRH